MDTAADHNVRGALPTEAFKNRLALTAQTLATLCLFLSVYCATSCARHQGWESHNTFLVLEVGALMGFWLGCLSYQLRPTKAAWFLMCASVLTGLVSAVLMSLV